MCLGPSGPGVCAARRSMCAGQGWDTLTGRKGGENPARLAGSTTASSRCAATIDGHVCCSAGWNQGPATAELPSEEPGCGIPTGAAGAWDQPGLGAGRGSVALLTSSEVVGSCELWRRWKPLQGLGLLSCWGRSCVSW